MQTLDQSSIKASRRSSTVEYAIRDLVVVAKKVGKDVIYLNIGDPVKFGFDTPQHIKDALINSVKEGKNYYGDSEGLPELREAIAARENRKGGSVIRSDDVIVTSGVSEGVSFLMGSLVNEGDEILLPGPSYQPYISYTKFYGGVPVEYKTVEEMGWEPDVEDLKRKIGAKTRAILLINPNNPTGGICNEKSIKEIISIASDRNLPIVVDEIYDELTYEGDFRGILSLARNDDVPIIGLNGFSKSSLMTGWRLGYVYFKDTKNGGLEEVRNAVAKLCRIRLCPNTPVQYAGLAALTGDRSFVGPVREELRRRRDYGHGRVNKIKGLSCVKPKGAFYLFPKILGLDGKTDMQFVLDFLKEKAVLVVPGSGFGAQYGSGHFRMVFLPPIPLLENALDKLESFMERRGS